MISRRVRVLAAVGVAAAAVAVATSLTSYAAPPVHYTVMKSPVIRIQHHSFVSAVSKSMRRGLAAPAVSIPLELVIPSIDVHSRMLAVGMTNKGAMAAPEGGANSPDWSDTFWYRGGAVPGTVGTATIAGHIDDRFGDYAVFGRLSELVRGDRIILRDTKTGFSERFVVTVSHSYSLAQSMTMPVLDLMYGTGPPRGMSAQPSRDGLAHLSLVTCAGQWLAGVGTHSERLVVSAVRVS